MFSFKNVSFIKSNNIILDNISCKIPNNKTTVIMGKNGSGKTTFLKILNKIFPPTLGNLDSNLDKSVPMLFQSPIIFENTVEYNYLILNKIKKNVINKKWFEAFSLNQIKNKNINTLSGGEKQKLFLSRIMSFDQDNLFLDEPNQGLDLESEKLFVNLLLNEKQKNKTIVLTLHDFKIAQKIADFIIYLDKGKVLLFEETSIFFKKFDY
jgi:ABC-type multidrug transport system ATPase subunit